MDVFQLWISKRIEIHASTPKGRHPRPTVNVENVCHAKWTPFKSHVNGQNCIHFFFFVSVYALSVLMAYGYVFTKLTKINYNQLIIYVIMATTSARDFVLEVIEKYKSFPCLWQIKHKDYHDRNKRNSAMNALLVLFKTKDPDANLDTVKKKLTSMRNCFKKEFNKVCISFFSFS